jgi:hypothetical protein
MDNDTRMLQLIGDSLVALQVKYKLLSIDDRATLKPSLQEVINDYASYQLRLLKEGVVSTDADIKEMAEIRSEIDAAGEKQSMLFAIARTIAFVGLRI